MIKKILSMVLVIGIVMLNVPTGVFADPPLAPEDDIIPEGVGSDPDYDPPEYVPPEYGNMDSTPGEDGSTEADAANAPTEGSIPEVDAADSEYDDLNDTLGGCDGSPHTQDSDGDGYTDEEEELAGTNPDDFDDNIETQCDLVIVIIETPDPNDEDPEYFVFVPHEDSTVEEPIVQPADPNSDLYDQLLFDPDAWVYITLPDDIDQWEDDMNDLADGLEDFAADIYGIDITVNPVPVDEPSDLMENEDFVGGIGDNHPAGMADDETGTIDLYCVVCNAYSAEYIGCHEIVHIVIPELEHGDLFDECTEVVLDMFERWQEEQLSDYGSDEADMKDLLYGEEEPPHTPGFTDEELAEMEAAAEAAAAEAE
ncbi:MAG: hypothetical protein HQ593_02895 [Candidatus Omnitrophica bacterium]|nr:hypothetical protein [Candidatus Omnitrophota bacterium]